ncbi:MAG: thioredoxin [Pseudomonadota bacterium]
MTDRVPNTSQASFAADVVAAERPVLVDFYADWCAPCRVIAPIVEDLAEELGDRLDVVKVDVDQNQSLAATYGIRGIPTLVLFKDGAPVETLVGLTTKDKLATALAPHV